MKVAAEMVNAIVDIKNGDRIVTLCDHKLRQQVSKKRGESRQSSIIALVTQALVRLISAEDTMTSIELPLLLRTCENLGKFLINRYIYINGVLLIIVLL